MKINISLLIFLSVILVACQNNPALDTSSSSAASIPVEPSAPVEPVTETLNIKSEPRYNIAVKNQEVKEFFYGLMQTVHQNIVVHPSVSGRISLLLQSVTIDEILKAVKDMYSYDYEKSAYGYTILPAILNTKVFTIDYLNINRKGSSSTRVSSGLTSSVDNQTTNSGSNTSSTTNTVLDSTSIETISDTAFWHDLKAMLSLLVDSSKGSLVMVNPQAGLVVVRGMPHELRSVENFLDRAQLSLNREVVLEAKIMEVTLHDRFQAGIDWTEINQYRGSSTVTSSLSSVPLANPDLIGGVFGLAINGNDFDGVIELLATQGEVSVLSSPRVATINNQKAAIKVGSNEYFVTAVSSTTTTGDATTETPEVTLTPFFSGIVLDVTPQIGDNQEVVLHVRPSVTEVVDQIKDIQIGSSDLSLPLAYTTVREADTVVRAKSNQVVLIGGLMSDNKSQLDAGVPWLSRIPILGWFFKQQRDEHLKRELVILLRPIITTETAETNWNSDQLQKVDATFTNGPWLKKRK